MPLGRWRDRVGEYIYKRGTGRGEGLEQAKKEEEALLWPGVRYETIDK